ncbi:hypothetical protein GCM10022419_099840 [Nonomuraea rosea]|uniref:Uncharacterized protein n=1 Tax=Nonomuraea rosea TaxID=638574 RepID=A0ABP6Z740_9ACTN
MVRFEQRTTPISQPTAGPRSRDLGRIWNQWLSDHGLVHPEPDRADPLPAQEREHETHRDAGAQLLGQLAGCRVLIRLAHVHGTADHHVIAARVSALRQLVLQAPPPVIANSLGFHHKTTTRLRRARRRILDSLRPSDHAH